MLLVPTDILFMNRHKLGIFGRKAPGLEADVHKMTVTSVKGFVQPTIDAIIKGGGTFTKEVEVIPDDDEKKGFLPLLLASLAVHLARKRFFREFR